MHLLKQTVRMQTKVRVNYLNCHIHVPSKHVEANSRHTYDVTIWLSRTTDNSNIFIRSREVWDNESRLYLCFKRWLEHWNTETYFMLQCYSIGLGKSGYQVNIFLISAPKHMLWVLLEASHWGTSNEYPQHIFSWKNKKKYQYFWTEKKSYRLGLTNKCDEVTRNECQ